ncbi:diguanylate cyclase (GGDEF) domain-containing protein [Paenibacillus sp. yr247]|uniref:diguanylate cyclase n=1 Tax=Paenibacillus sp. yr247 TaxID=1761880 RepID=UPI000881F1D5|nr:diguanylate cyclase [Paenibacillus sp. yr247]SDN28475.1 diguanylate cyclase (GGDEF) domain-containing protein [Paenibacillus sp. yr247]
MSNTNLEQLQDSTSESDRDARILKQGRKLFIREFEKQLKQLNSLLDKIRSAPVVHDLNQFYRIIHTLKGSAPIFGYVRIGKLADDLVRAWEWTQSLDIDSEAVLLQLNPIHESAEHSLHVLRDMNMECDIGVTEIQIDEQQDPAGVSMLGSMKSRLLLVDDDEVLRSYLTRRLQLDDCIVDEAADVESAKKLLRLHTYDLVTLDLMMHPQSGYELFEFLKDDPTLKCLPLIVLSGRNDLNDKVRCFHLGADDYVTKPFQYEELAARIYGLLKRTKNFEQLAFRDPLTGVFNRRYFDQQIRMELQRIELYPAPISLVFIDIDCFKKINDTYGHHVGDLVLQGLAHLLQVNLRSTDLLARFGGEEFVIALPNTAVEQAITTMQDILDKVRTKAVAQYEGQTFSITFSAGVAEWQEGMTVAEWVSKADDAMYQAKQQGRNRIVGASEEDDGGTMPRKSAATPQLPKKNLLIVENDPILRAILTSHLEHLPITITLATNGEEALGLLLGRSFDACILDGMMPKLDGFTLLEQIKKDTRLSHRDMKVLMLSGKKKEEDVARGFQMGADDYMTKPFSLVELEVRVKQLMNFV